LQADIGLQRALREENEHYREALAIAELRKTDLIFPVFVSEKSHRIDAMPGISVIPLRDTVRHVQSVLDYGITSIIIFGVPECRDLAGSSAADKNGIVQKTLREVKAAFGSSITSVTDVCVCQYNTSGHCGIIRGDRIINDETLDILARIAVSHTEAGADAIAPSSMMDGQVGAIRNALDERGLKSRMISYSAKHASSLYAPFRAAAFANPRAQIDKSSYQVSYSNPRQAMREIQNDIDEGADMVMVKPALVYLDLVRMAKEEFGFPIAVQNVSGEYAMIKAAALKGWINEEEWIVASLASMKRAGVDKIISYFALDVASKFL
jgi:porphobilinogen synthase